MPPAAALAAAAAGAPQRYACAGNHSGYAFCDTALPVADRVRALVGLLTPEEKGGLMTARVTARSNAVPRLGVPEFCWGQNAARGSVQTALPKHGGGLTTFPRAPGIAATWNMSVVRAQGAVLATEARSVFNEGGAKKGVFQCPGSVVLWGPTVNLNRDPRWGRNGETPSEDPLLNGAYGAAFADGAQRGAEDPRYVKAIVTLKHWGAYSVEHDREGFDAAVSAFDMADSYAPIFERAVRGYAGPDGAQYQGALGVMCSYNSVNGVPACASKEMLTEMLRGNWSFDGYVVGDSDTVQYIYKKHHYAADPAGAVRAALEAGTDMESWCDGGGDGKVDYYRDLAPAMLRNGSLPAALVDRAVSRLLSLRFRAGLFDPAAGQPFARIGAGDRGTAESAAAALDAARQSLTLLANRAAALPLRAGRRLAVVGPYASYGHGAALGDELARLNTGGATEVVKGCAVAKGGGAGVAAAAAAAAAADAVVLALGADGAKEHESVDRRGTTLPRAQSDLAAAVVAAARGNGTAVVLVLFNWGQVSTEELNRGVDALLMAYMPHVATHIAEAVFGALNPGGKLPYTIYPDNYTSQVDFLDMSMTAGPGRGYRYYTGTPLFAFGFGLSYTRFNLSVAPAAGASPARGYSVVVANTGGVAGTETVQLYFRPPRVRGWAAPLPRRRLVDWRKVRLAAGEAARVAFAVTAEQLRLVDTAGRRRTVPGTYTLVFTNGADQSVEAPFVVAA